jgi:hypothetical protein
MGGIHMAGKYNRDSAKKWWQPVLAGICCFAIIATTFSPLVKNVWAQELPETQKTLICGKKEHTHTDACYTLTCTNTDPTHVHDASCYTLTCGKEEHTHTDACYEAATDTDATASSERDSTSSSAESSESMTTEPESETTAEPAATSETSAQDSDLQSKIDEAQAKKTKDQAIALEFSDGETSEVEEMLGYTVKGAHEEASTPTSDSADVMRTLMLQSVSDSSYRFNAYYIQYANNLATTKTDTVQDLIGNMSATKQTIKYQLDFHNDTDYEIGEVVIKVPYSIYTDRYGQSVTPSDLGVPLSPAVSSASAFNYTIDTANNQIILTNCKKINSGSNNLIQIFYDIDDMASVDSSIAGGTQWSIHPVIVVKGVEDASAAALTGSIDTKTDLSLTEKKAYEVTDSKIYPELYTQSQIENAMGSSALPAGFTADFDNNVYMLWRTEIKGVADQPWDMTITDTPADDGTVIGQFLSQYSYLNYEEFFSTPGNTITVANQALYGVQDLLQPNYTDKLYVYSLVQYPLAVAPDGTKKAGAATDNHVHNTISVTLTGKDDQITHTLSSSNEWTWDPYNWVYSGDIIGVQKFYGGYQEEIDPGTLEDSWLAVYKQNKTEGKDTSLPQNWDVRGILHGYDLIYVPNPITHTRTYYPTFTFEMYINDVLSANHTYYIVDPAFSMQREPRILDTRTTDANGRFTLKAGQRICLVQNTGETYKFKEVAMSAPNDYTTANDTASGSAALPYVSASITNDYKWKDIYFTKTVEDLDNKKLNTTETFNFKIYVDQDHDGAAEDREPFANQPYVLVDKEGNTIANSGGTTGADGSFTLQAGQRIKFSHIEKGTAYRFAETLTAQQLERYRNYGDISGNTPTYASGADVIYRNIELSTALEIQKKVLSAASEADAAANQSFTFTLYVWIRTGTAALRTPRFIGIRHIRTQKRTERPNL